MKINNLFHVRGFAILLGILSLVPFIIISVYNHPAVDDFCYHNKSVELGFIDAQVFWYELWTGRFIATFFLSIPSIVSGSFFWYKLLPVILLALLCLGFYKLLSALFVKLNKINKIVIVCAIFALYMMQIPSIAQGFYWMPGSITYQLPIILGLFLFSILFKQQNSKRQMVKVFLLCFMIAGSNETYMIIINFLVFTFLICNYVKYNKLNKRILFTLTSLIFFSVISIFSPGNAKRASNFDVNHQFFYALTASLSDAMELILFSLPDVLIFLFVAFFYLIKYPKSLSPKFFQINPFFVFFVMIFITCIGFFPAYWSLGSSPPLRSVNVIYFFFLFGFIYFALTVFFKLKESGYEIKEQSTRLLILPIVLILLRLPISNNIKYVYVDLFSKRAYNYNKELENRYHLIENGESTVSVPQLIHTPVTIYFDDIAANPEDWRNKCYDSYFGKTILIE